ncbi:MAG: hypothetical protein ACUVWK_01960 [Nitrososphaerales archaeon]
MKKNSLLRGIGMEPMKKIAGISLLIFILFNLASTSMAAATNPYTDIGSSEKSIITELNTFSASDSDLEEVERIRQEIEQEMKKQIEQSINSLIESPTRAGIVYLGTDKTFTDADKGDHGTWYSGLIAAFYGSNHILSEKKDEAACTGGLGVGAVGAWAWIGKEFYVSGSGSRSANIIVAGHMWGLTSAVGPGSAQSKITFVVLDRTSGTMYTTIIYQQVASGFGWYEVNQDFNNGVGVTLVVGRTYIAYVLVETSISIYVSAEAGADFGPQDGDPGGYVNYSSITIDF